MFSVCFLYSNERDVKKQSIKLSKLYSIWRKQFDIHTCYIFGSMCNHILLFETRRIFYVRHCIKHSSRSGSHSWTNCHYNYSLINLSKKLGNFDEKTLKCVIDEDIIKKAIGFHGGESGKSLSEQHEKIICELNKRDKALNKKLKSLNADSQKIYETAVNMLTENAGAVIGELFDLLENKNGLNANDLGIELEIKLDELQNAAEKQIANLVEKGGNALSELANEAKTEIMEAAEQGAESLKNTLKDKIGNVFGPSTTAEKSTDNVVFSLLSWSYSDYLQLFLLIATVASPESVLLRTADVIELNMQLLDENMGFIVETTEQEVSRLWGLIKYTETVTTVKANDEAFKMSKAYTYLNIKATIEVKPIMLSLPLVAGTVKSQLTGSNWYQITYEGTMGY